MNMNVIKIDLWDPDDASELISIAESNEGIDAVQEKNFSGDITTLELYVSLGVNVLTIIVSVINTLIQKKKVSSIKINGEAVEINNVSQDLIEKVLNAKLNLTDNYSGDNDTD